MTELKVVTVCMIHFRWRRNPTVPQTHFNITKIFRGSFKLKHWSKICLRYGGGGARLNHPRPLSIVLNIFFISNPTLTSTPVCLEGSHSTIPVSSWRDHQQEKAFPHHSGVWRYDGVALTPPQFQLNVRIRCVRRRHNRLRWRHSKLHRLRLSRYPGDWWLP